MREVGREQVVGRKAARFHRRHHVPRPTRAWNIRNQNWIRFWPERHGPRPGAWPACLPPPCPSPLSALAGSCGIVCYFLSIVQLFQKQRSDKLSKSYECHATFDEILKTASFKTFSHMYFYVQDVSRSICMRHPEIIFTDAAFIARDNRGHFGAPSWAILESS